MKTIVCNQIPYLHHYIYFYLKELPNYFHLNYRNFNDFEFFSPDRALLIINEIDELSERFIRDTKKKGIFLTLITENKDIKLDVDLTFLVREKDNYLDKLYKSEEIPSEYNYSNMHLMTPKILSWIKKKKKGNYNFFNKESCTYDDIFKESSIPEDLKNPIEKCVIGESGYVKPSEGCDISEEKLNLKEKFKVNIYTATYYRYEKTKKSIESLLDLAKKSRHDVKIYIGDNNSKIDEMRDWLKELNEKEELVEVYFSEKNNLLKLTSENKM